MQTPPNKFPTRVTVISSKPAKYALAVAASLMLTFVFTGCSASGPLQSHSAFKQSVLPSGYQTTFQNPGFGAQSFGAPSANSFNGSGSRGASFPGHGGQAFPQHQGHGGMLNPFAGGGNFSSGSC